MGDRIGGDHARRQGGNRQLGRNGLSIEAWFHGGQKSGSSETLPRPALLETDASGACLRNFRSLEIS